MTGRAAHIEHAGLLRLSRKGSEAFAFVFYPSPGWNTEARLRGNLTLSLE